MTIPITGTYNSTQYLALDTVATVTSSGKIVAPGPGSAALYAYGYNTNVWTVTNDGTIIGTGAGGGLGVTGIQLGGGGSYVASGYVTNQTDVLISGSRYGIRIYDVPGDVSSSIVNQSSATIYGANGGILVSGYGTVTNSGTITAGAASSGADVVLDDGGVVSNASGGLIQGYTGVYLSGAGSVTNSGMISGLTILSGEVGVSIAGNAEVTNEPLGTIQGFVGVVIGGTGTVINYGLISGQSVSSTGVGVVLNGGGALTNISGGTIQGYQGVVVAGAAGTVTNYGQISGQTNTSGGVGVVLNDGGALSNVSGGVIQGYQGVVAAGAAGTVTNYGLISAPESFSSVGVSLNDGGAVSDASTGTIQGFTAVYLELAGTVTNDGLVSSTDVSVNASGVLLKQGGVVNNSSTGEIQGDQAVAVLGAAGTVTNHGLISGQTAQIGSIGVSLKDGGAVSNVSGGTIQGYQGIVVAAATGAVTNHGLISGQTASIGGIGVSLKDGGVLSNASGGVIQGYQGVLVAGAAGTVINDGSIISSGAGAYAVTFSIASSANLLTVDPGASFVGSINGGTGTIELAAGSPGSLGGFGVSITNFGTLQFDPSAAWTVSANYGGLSTEAITGFENGTNNTIELTGFVASSEAYATNALTLGDGGGDYETLAIQGGSSSSSGFQVTNDSINTFIVDCFASGTHIARPGGTARVEDLAIGDLVSTHFAGSAAIEWIGRRYVDCTRHPDPRTVWPVRVAAGTFGPATPSRDLTLSPNHGVYVNGELIPIGRLLNGTSIIQTPMDEVTYYHVELAQHDLLLAEGVWAESYLDVGDRSNFGDVGGEIRLFPDFAKCSPDVAAAWETRGCAPLLLCGPRLEKVRDWIIALADDAHLAAVA